MARLQLEHVSSMAVVSLILCLTHRDDCNTQCSLSLTLSNLTNGGVEFSLTSVVGEGKRMAVESTKGADADRKGGATNDDG